MGFVKVLCPLLVIFQAKCFREFLFHVVKYSGMGKTTEPNLETRSSPWTGVGTRLTEKSGTWFNAYQVMSGTVRPEALTGHRDEPGRGYTEWSVFRADFAPCKSAKGADPK